MKPALVDRMLIDVISELNKVTEEAARLRDENLRMRQMLKTFGIESLASDTSDRIAKEGK